MIIRANNSSLGRLLIIALFWIFCLHFCWLLNSIHQHRVDSREIFTPADSLPSQLLPHQTRQSQDLDDLTWQETIVIILVSTYHSLQHQSISLSVRSQRDAPGSLFLSERHPWADRSTRTCWTPYRRGWGHNSLWPLAPPTERQKPGQDCDTADADEMCGSGMRWVPDWMSGRRRATACCIRRRWGTTPPTCLTGCPEIHLPGQWCPLQWTCTPTTGHIEQAICRGHDCRDDWCTKESLHKPQKWGENFQPVIQSLFKLIGWLQTFKDLKQEKQEKQVKICKKKINW